MPGNSINDQEFIQRLTEITEANLSNDQFGVNELAKEFGKSRSYIHKHLKSISNESVSLFIRRIRLEKSLEMLRKNKATVAEIAYEVGFGSPSYFTKCFHEHFGYSPSEFSKHDKGDNQNQEICHSNKIADHRIFTRQRGWYVLGFILLLIPLLFLANKYLFKKPGRTDLEKTIAVLPFKNLSGDENNKYFAEGMTDDIINHLAHINDFTIKARTSTEQYRETEKTLSEIAKELGVSYVIEGTVQKYNDRVKIIIQLHDYNGDDIWSDSFNREISDIFNLQSEIAKQVASELKVVLSPIEIEQIGKTYTDNTEAYSLYQKGRHFWHRRTENDLNTSIYYFNQALTIDSTYALAHAGLADAFYIQAWWGWSSRAYGYSRSKANALKALEFDNNLAEAHATLGAIACWFDYNWKFAEKHLSRAVELNPNNTDANQYLSEYYEIHGNCTQGRFYINKSIDLNPYSKVTYYESGLYYYNEGKWDEALKEGVKVLELDENFKKWYLINFMIYLHKREDKQAIANLLKFLVIDSAGEDYGELVNTVYKESGINGVIRWTIDKLLQNSNVDFFNIAKLYGILQDSERTLEYLSKAFVSSSQIPRMKNSYDFKFISDEPEFQMLLKKLNLPLN